MRSYPHHALIVAGIVFAIVALMHVIRLTWRWTIVIAERKIPFWASFIAIFISLILSIWMFIASCPCYASTSGGRMTLQLHSSAFTHNSLIPAKHTCEGSDIFPSLSWKNIPENTKSFVLIMDDPDATKGTWDHLIIFNIPATTHALPEQMSSLPNGARYGKNSWGKLAYGGPCPPQGEHRYFFKLYALDATLELPAGASKQEIVSAMQNHILAETHLIGRYKKTGG